MDITKCLISLVLFAIILCSGMLLVYKIADHMIDKEIYKKPLGNFLMYAFFIAFDIVVLLASFVPLFLAFSF